MNFLSGLQEQARQAAAQASALAQQVGSHTAALATSASGQAQQSFKSLSVPTSLQQRFEGLRLTGAQQQQQAAPSDAQLAAYGITPEFQAFVRGLNYASFRDSPGGEQPSTSTSGASSSAEQQQQQQQQQDARYLTPWQEQHALLICRQVKEVDELRFVLCPKRMSDQQFWAVYFQLVRRHLPEAAYDLEAPLPELPSQADAGQSPVSLRERLQSLSTSAQQWMAAPSTTASAAGPASSAAEQPAPQAEAASAPEQPGSSSRSAELPHVPSVPSVGSASEVCTKQ